MVDGAVGGITVEVLEETGAVIALKEVSRDVSRGEALDLEVDDGGAEEEEEEKGDKCTPASLSKDCCRDC